MLHSMETIQVVLDPELLHAADDAAKRAGVNRSALVRRALREHLKQIKRQELEARDRRGYQQHPDNLAEVEGWERMAAWPDR
ncbi:MAG TPA: ribbon-helix-helix domain-containing protein [Terriglobia bacterium]|nr:ribbon-helix-helix domain-containing protein [Terriglobia bacterium]